MVSANDLMVPPSSATACRTVPGAAFSSARRNGGAMSCPLTAAIAACRKRNSQEPGRGRGSDPCSERGPQERGQGQDADHRPHPCSDGHRSLRPASQAAWAARRLADRHPRRPGRSVISRVRPAWPRRLFAACPPLPGHSAGEQRSRRELAPLVARAAPSLVALSGVGTETAGQLLITAGDNPDRLRCEAAFAHLLRRGPGPGLVGP